MTPDLLDQRDLRQIAKHRTKSPHGTFLVYRDEGSSWSAWMFVIRRPDYVLRSKSYSDAVFAHAALAHDAAELGLVPVYVTDVAGVLEVRPEVTS
jgi:hypothetical protein